MELNNALAIQNRIKGCLFGQAIGDALGLGSEFMPRNEVTANYPDGLTDYTQIVRDFHRGRWHKGDWTDDTDMMLCIAHAIIQTGKTDIPTIAYNFKKWFEGEPMGIGRHTYNVLSMCDYEEKPFEAARLFWELSKKHSVSNGGLMRTSIIGLLPNYKHEDAENVCRFTHFDPRCVGSCVIICDLIHAHVYDEQVPHMETLCNLADQYDGRITTYIKHTYDGQLNDVCLDDTSMGYTLHILFAALWAYWHAD